MAYVKKTERAPKAPNAPWEFIRLFHQLDEAKQLNYMACILSEWTYDRMCEARHAEIDEIFSVDHSTLSTKGITMLARLTMGLKTPNRQRFMEQEYVQKAVREVLPGKYAVQVLTNKYLPPNETEEQ